MAPAVPSLRIGDVAIWVVLDGWMTLPEPPGFPSKDSPDFAVHADYVRDGRWVMDIGGFLVQAGDRLVLIDAGSGEGDGAVFTPPFAGVASADPEILAYARRRGITEEAAMYDLFGSRSIRTGSFGANLRALGFRPDQVTDVLVSHLHFDDIGWVSSGGRPYFPNAVVRCERHDADYFLGPGAGEREHSVVWNALPTTQRLAPVLGRFETWDEDAVLAPGVEARFAPGHTPGSSIFVLSSGDEQVLVLGDTVHCPQELADPAFPAPANMDVEEGARSVAMIRELAVSSGARVTSPHFPGLRFGRLVAGDRPRQWSFRWAA